MSSRAQWLAIPDNNVSIKCLVELVPEQQLDRLILSETEKPRQLAVNLIRVFIVCFLGDTVFQGVRRVWEHRRGAPSQSLNHLSQIGGASGVVFSKTFQRTLVWLWKRLLVELIVAIYIFL